ncbi:penicillin-binding protein 2 [Chelativorans sp. ZYF759]|uniref:peptidoglycan D,D-transpeptidase FtsI family protein n=1 Tax=Chelativorans sp. ZYF759 TaxID=2692213 RepID=UPI00145E627D|nr:penicillin-binding protein 2 [Chelativorans sp. ZYF759]NMG41490.1 penicillin-binding protein 2 [Chelativorans sp. ZYF759]
MIGRWFSRKGSKGCEEQAAPIVVKGARQRSAGDARLRIGMTMAVFFGIYAVIGGRLAYLGMQEVEAGGPPPARVTASRPDIVDRNGEVLATDINTASLFAEPRRIVDVDEAVEKLLTVLPDLDVEMAYRRLSTQAGFVWLRRQLSPRQQQAIMDLGVPGLGFRTEKRRFYPGGPTAAHVLGLVNVDNNGIAGMEKWIDDQGLAELRALGLVDEGSLEPVRLSLDLRVQHIVRDELVQAMERYDAIGAAATVVNARTGEVMAMVSLPDYDPNNPFNAHEKDRLNRITAGVYEMGSTFKIFATAMALDSGLFNLNSRFDASHPIRIAGHWVRDFRGRGRVLTFPEVFIYSSNIGTARMADAVGIEGHREFLARLGLLDRMKTELPEVARPTEPATWRKINSITASFGYGVSTTPMQTAIGSAALLNGGKLINPTFLPRSEEDAMANAVSVVDQSTVDAMRYMFRVTVESGTATRAEVPGYFVGGKTGTAEKVENGRYVSGKRFNGFVSAFPSQDPEYVVLVVLDEPKPERPGIGATAGLNTAPVGGNIIRRSAALLGVKPDFGQDSGTLLVSHQ